MTKHSVFLIYIKSHLRPVLLAEAEKRNIAPTTLIREVVEEWLKEKKEVE